MPQLICKPCKRDCATTQFLAASSRPAVLDIQSSRATCDLFSARMENPADQTQPPEANVPSSNGDAAAPKHPISSGTPVAEGSEEPPAKKTKVDESSEATGQSGDDVLKRKKGVAPIKPEYVLPNQLRTAHILMHLLGTLLP